MDDIIRVKGQFYILGSSSMADEQSRVLKHADTFAVFDRHGDIRPLGFEDHGLYHEGTRFLSRHVIKLEDKSPLLLSSTVRENNEILVVDLTKPDFVTSKGDTIDRGVLHIGRSIFLFEGAFYERIQIANYGLDPIQFSFTLEFEADYVDIFEVRGMKRKKRGNVLEASVKSKEIVLGYEGIDTVKRFTRIRFSPKAEEVAAGRAKFSVSLDPQGSAAFDLTISCDGESEAPDRREGFDQAFRKVQAAHDELQKDTCHVETSNEQFNDWLNRSTADIRMMLTRTDCGFYPYAGIPWFNTVFGRDGIITAFETLWIYPDIAKGVLSYLASKQAKTKILSQDAEPGKILHEERKGEMVALKEIPFGQYYGTIDATPLFVVLAGHYYERSGDLDFIRKLWPAIEKALSWIDTYGDSDGDGFVEYASNSDGGLSNQGWKDSDDSVFYANGKLAAPAIALCEVQGYVYEAKQKAGMLALRLDKKKKGEELQREAETLQKKFVKSFWLQKLGTYAIALDGKKKRCKVRSSNAGHCLFSGIATEEHARSIAGQMLEEEFFTGWGIRTIASSEPRYNPMSYHNGSVWPHDNALIGYGMSRYGLKEEVAKVMTGLFDASIFADSHRLPELFCGFNRCPGEGPTLYPVACDPQAWASAAVFLLLQACLGISIQAQENKVYVNKPILPPFLQEVTVKNLRVGASSLDITFKRHEQDVTINVMRKDGDVELVATK